MLLARKGVREKETRDEKRLVRNKLTRKHKTSRIQRVEDNRGEINHRGGQWRRGEVSDLDRVA